MKLAREVVTPRAGEPRRSVVLGTAGHIDHGKTALVLALTGTDTDRLPEEKSRSITIDLGFASLQLAEATGQGIDLNLIDVPGHHAFIRNMLAGAGGIDCVMLVIAADEGVKAQTTEHLAICTLLGIRRGLVALTKSDAVGEERLAAARAEVTRFVEHTFLAGAPIVAVSARTRAGIPELKRALAQMASQVPERSAEFLTRMPLDRAFTMRGFGTVVTGTLQSGAIYAGESLALVPGQRTVRVRGVQVHGETRHEAQAPGRVALNLAGVEVADVHRGDMLVPPGTLEAVDTVDAEFHPLAGAPVLRHRARVRVHALAAESLATVLLFDTGTAVPDGLQLVRLRLAKPLVVAPGDRFVVRSASPAATLGGGLVLDAHPSPRQRKAATTAWLQRLRSAPGEERLRLRVGRRSVDGIALGDLVRETGLRREVIQRLLKPSLTQGQLVSAAEGTGERYLAPEALREAQDRILREVARGKGEGVPRAEVRSRTGLAEWVLALGTDRLRNGRQLVTRGDLLLQPGQGATTAGAPNRQMEAVEALYVAAGLASPILSEVATRLRIDPKLLPGIITSLLRAKKLVRMGADNLFIHADALGKLVTDLQRHRGESFDVPRFKSFANLTRKHAIPVLEYLDGARVTRNSNGTRVVL